MNKEQKKNKKNKKPRPELEKVVIDASRSDVWAKAKEEWYICDYDYDESRDGVCICGQVELCHLYTIRNLYTQNTLFYIGSVCIDYFGSKRLSTQKEYMDKDDKKFDPPGTRTKVSGMTYFQIYRSHLSWLEYVVANRQKWNDISTKGTIRRNKAFLDIIKWYQVRNPMLLKRQPPTLSFYD